MNAHLSIVSPIAGEGPPEAECRHALRQLAGGIALVTCAEGEHRNGAVVTTLSVLPTNPPTLIASIANNAPVWPAIARRRAFGINLLDIRHFALAKRFAGTDEAGHFDQGNWSVINDRPPILKDALASFECELEEAVERGSHVLLIGRVRDARASASGEPLLHWQGTFRVLATTQDDWTPLVAPKIARKA